MYNILSKDKIKYLIVHCSDTNDDFTIEEIHKMHLDFGWDGIGYHKVIDQKGEVYNGRPEYWTGAHVKGFNDKSLGVCLIGRNVFSKKQLNSLINVLKKWKKTYPMATIMGHKDVTMTKKTCPNFDVLSWVKKNKII